MTTGLRFSEDQLAAWKQRGVRVREARGPAHDGPTETGPETRTVAQDGAAAARLAHNQEVGGASPPPASTPPPRRSKRLARPEDALQVLVAEYLDRALDRRWRWFHVPNGGARSKAEAGKFKAFGVKAGVPDVVIVSPEGRVVWIELKAREGALSKPQRGWRNWARAEGQPWFLCRTLDHVIEALDTAGVPHRGRLQGARPQFPDAASGKAGP